MSDMGIEENLRHVLHGEPLTHDQREAHEEAGESTHVPAIIHRTGGISSAKLNRCGICGAPIKPRGQFGWIAITEKEADRLRRTA